MNEAVLKALLADTNVQRTVSERVMVAILDKLKEGQGPRDGNGSVLRYDLFRSVFTQRGPTGPRVVGLRGTVRATRIVPLQTFLRFQSPSIRFGFDRFSERVIQAMLLSSKANLLGPYAINWVGLHDELASEGGDSISTNLGLFNTRNDPLAAISYDVDSSELHIPTVIDAHLLPWFVSKPSKEVDHSRAWNWHEGKWGFRELVHATTAKIRNPSIKILKRTHHSRPALTQGFATFAPFESKILEQVVEKIIRRTLAHRDLEPFLKGTTDLLNITHREFEHFLGRLYERRGYRTTVTRASRDGGIDIIALSDSRRQEGLLIQAKHTKGKVGIKVVRELIGARLLADAKYSRSMLVVATTGVFSSPAKAAQKQIPLELNLRDFTDLQREIRGLRRIGITDIARDALRASR